MDSKNHLLISQMYRYCICFGYLIKTIWLALALFALPPSLASADLIKPIEVACQFGVNEFPDHYLSGELGDPTQKLRYDTNLWVMQKAVDKYNAYYIDEGKINFNPFLANLKPRTPAGRAARYRFAPFLLAAMYESLVISDSKHWATQTCLKKMFESYVSWTKFRIAKAKLVAWCKNQLGENCPLSPIPINTTGTGASKTISLDPLPINAAQLNVSGTKTVKEFKASLVNPLALGLDGKASLMMLYGPLWTSVSAANMYSPIGLSANVLRDTLLPILLRAPDTSASPVTRMTDNNSPLSPLGNPSQSEDLKEFCSTRMKMTVPACIGTFFAITAGGGGALGYGIHWVWTKIIRPRRTERQRARINNQLTQEMFLNRPNLECRGTGPCVIAEQFEVTNGKFPNLLSGFDSGPEEVATLDSEVLAFGEEIFETFGAELEEVIGGAGLLSPEGVIAASAAGLFEVALDEYQKLNAENYTKLLIAHQAHRLRPVVFEKLLNAQSDNANERLAGRMLVFNLLLRMIVAGPADRGQPTIAWSIAPADFNVHTDASMVYQYGFNNLGYADINIPQKPSSSDDLHFTNFNWFANGAGSTLQSGNWDLSKAIFPVDVNGDGNSELVHTWVHGFWNTLGMVIHSRATDGPGYEKSWGVSWLKLGASGQEISDTRGFLTALDANTGGTQLIQIVAAEGADEMTLIRYKPWPQPRHDANCFGKRSHCYGYTVADRTRLPYPIMPYGKILAGDFNGDGYVDIAQIWIANQCNNCSTGQNCNCLKVQIFSENPNGSGFIPESGEHAVIQEVPTFANYSAIPDAMIVDSNNDGKDEIFMPYYNPMLMGQYLWTYGNTFIVKQAGNFLQSANQVPDGSWHRWFVVAGKSGDRVAQLFINKDSKLEATLFKSQSLTPGAPSGYTVASTNTLTEGPVLGPVLTASKWFVPNPSWSSDVHITRVWNDDSKVAVTLFSLVGTKFEQTVNKTFEKANWIHLANSVSPVQRLNWEHGSAR